MCSDDDLRAIVHEHQLRWSPQMMSMCRGHRTSRASSLDTASHSQSAVFSSSVESLSQSPVIPAVHSVQQPLPSTSSSSEHAETAVRRPSDLSLTHASADTQLRRKVFHWSIWHLCQCEGSRPIICTNSNRNSRITLVSCVLPTISD